MPFPEYLSSWPSPNVIWTWRETVSVIPLSLIILGTVLGNCLVLYVFATRPRTLRFPTHYFIANLALCDLLVGLGVMPFLLSLFLTKTWYFGPAGCTAWTVYHFMMCGSSILSTCSICIERYIGVRWPLRHKEILTRNRIYLGILGVWLTSAFLMSTSLFLFPDTPSTDWYDCPVNRRPGHILIAVVGSLYIPAAIMIILYWKIFEIATKHTNALRVKINQPLSSTKITGSGVVTTGPSSSSGGRDPESAGSTTQILPQESGSKNKDLDGTTRKQINLANRLAFLVGVMLLSYGPPFTLNLYMTYNPGQVPDRVFLTLAWLRYFNSCINPLIYAFAVPAYRKAMLNVLSKIIPSKTKALK